MFRIGIMIFMLGIVTLTGCTSIGVPSIQRDRFDYNIAIAESWKSQMLLNIVKIRYADPPVFMDVSSVINQVGIQNTFNLSAGWSFPPSGNSQSIGGTTTVAEKPTITYAPLSGEKFTRSLLTPISPPSLLYLIQAGWPVRQLFGLCVKSINNMDNQSSAPGFARTMDPEFQQLIELLEKIQKSGAVGNRIERKGKEEAAVIILRRKAGKGTDLEISEAGRLLGLKPETTEFKVIYGAAPMQQDDVAILTRSIMDIIIELSAQIEVPIEQAAEGRTYATSSQIGDGKGQVPPLIRIHCSKEKPSDSFVAINNRNYWFWIDDRDRPSKSIFTFLMILFSLAETGQSPQAPIISIPIS